MKARCITFCLAGLSLVSPMTFAAGTDWFSGIVLTRPMSQEDARAVSARIDDTYKSRRIYGAYQISRALGLEVGADLPRIELRDNGLFEPGSLAPGAKAKGWQLSSTGTLPIGRKLGVTGKVGAYRGELDLGPTQATLDDGKTKAIYGLGVQYDVTQNFRLQGGWDRYYLGTQNQTPEAQRNIDLLTIGLKYKF
ncbi:MAG: outer membrane beta-barrel protein [Burkholderiales bacterium]